MITVEKDAKAEEIFIHATPEDLREFAKTLWAISQKAELKGKHKEQLTTKKDSDVKLSSSLNSDSGKHSVIKKLTIHSKVS
jgi:hypothetical protein